MKKIIVISFALLALAACGGNDSKESTDKKAEGTEEKKEGSSALSDNPDYQKGLEVMGKSNCAICHKVDERVPGQGPTLREVADKYASYPDTIVAHLANKIVNGGSGVWGDVPMIPHPELTQQDATAIVKYILLLKK